MSGLVQIFKVDNTKLELNPECFLIKELKAIVNKYKDPIPPLTYIYFRTNPYSLYNNLSEKDRSNSIYKDYPGDYTVNDPLIIEAEKKLLQYYKTPLQEYYESQKHALLEMSKFRKTISSKNLDASERGDFKTLEASLLKASQLAKAFSELEKVYIEELQAVTRGRGNVELGYEELSLEDSYDENMISKLPKIVE